MQPKYPLISIYNKGIDLIPDSSSLTKATVLGILNGKYVSFAFDSNDCQWEYQLISNKVKDNFLTRLLANTFYNPIVDVKPIWTLKGNYDIDKLKSLINDCVDQDDYILTQFVESETVKRQS
jgi:hypothetical protein